MKDNLPAISEYLSKLLSIYPHGYELDGHVLKGEQVAAPKFLLSLFLLDAQIKSSSMRVPLQTELVPQTEEGSVLDEKLVPLTRSFAEWTHMLLAAVNDLWVQYPDARPQQKPIPLDGLWENWVAYTQNRTAALTTKVAAPAIGSAV